MPIGPKRSGSADSMMQYTYLPRLPTAASGVTERPWTIFSDARRAGSALTARASRAAGLAVLPFGLDGEFAPELFAATADAIFLPPDRTAGAAGFVKPGAPVPRTDPLRALADVGLAMFAAPADFLPRGGRGVVQHLANLLHEIFRQARLGDERVAAGALGALGNPGERVARERHDRNAGRALVGLEAPRRFPAVHHRQRQIHEDDIGRLLGRLRQRFHPVLRLDHLEAGELEVLGIHFPRIRIVVDDQDARPRSMSVSASAHRLPLTGSVSVNVDPLPISLW